MDSTLLQTHLTISGTWRAHGAEWGCCRSAAICPAPTEDGVPCHRSVLASEGGTCLADLESGGKTSPAGLQPRTHHPTPTHMLHKAGILCHKGIQHVSSCLRVIGAAGSHGPDGRDDDVCALRGLQVFPNYLQEEGQQARHTRHTPCPDCAACLSSKWPWRQTRGRAGTATPGEPEAGALLGWGTALGSRRMVGLRGPGRCS